MDVGSRSKTGGYKCDPFFGPASSFVMMVIILSLKRKTTDLSCIDVTDMQLQGIQPEEGRTGILLQTHHSADQRKVARCFRYSSKATHMLTGGDAISETESLLAGSFNDSQVNQGEDALKAPPLSAIREWLCSPGWHLLWNVVAVNS